MTLRLKLFGLIGGLLALMVGAEWFLIDSLTEDLRSEVGAVASSVGKDLVKVLVPRVRKLEKVLPSSDELRRLREHAEEPRVIALPDASTVSVVGKAETVRRHGEATREPEGKAAGKAAERHVERFVVTTLRTDGDGMVSTRSWTTSGTAGFLFVEGPDERTRIEIPGKGVKEAVARFRTRLLLGSLGIVGVGLLAAAFVAHRVSRPLAELSRAARAVGEGGFGAQVLTREGGEVGEAIAAFNQMSSRLEALEREALALKEREHLGEMGDVARGMAHALRNPLHAVGLSVDELAARLPDDAEAAALAEGARRQISGVDGTIRSFLALAAGGGTEEDLDLAALVEEVALSALQEARGRVRVAVEPAGERPRLPVVAPELRAALHALVVNAVEASPDGATVAVSVGGLPGGGARVTVEDEGPGLPAEVRARLFTPHVTTKPSGSGMGLYLAHRIATTRYGGSLAVEDRSPRGTRAVLEVGPRNGGLRA